MIAYMYLKPILPFSSALSFNRKGSMEEYVRTLDMSEVYQESFGKLSAVLKKLNPKDEYIGLMKDNKRLSYV